MFKNTFSLYENLKLDNACTITKKSMFQRTKANPGPNKMTDDARGAAKTLVCKSDIPG